MNKNILRYLFPFFLTLLIPISSFAGLHGAALGALGTAVIVSFIVLSIGQLTFLFLLFKLHKRKQNIILIVLFDVAFIIYTSFVLFFFSSAVVKCGYGAGLWQIIIRGSFAFNVFGSGVLIILFILSLVKLNKWKFSLTIKNKPKFHLIFLLLITVGLLTMYESRIMGPYTRWFVNADQWGLHLLENRYTSCLDDNFLLMYNQQEGEHIEAISRHLKNKNSNVRRKAILLLMKDNSPRIIKLLETSLDDEDPGIRQLAVEALWRTGRASAVTPLIVALKDQNVNVRMEAIRHLSNWGDFSIVEPLIDSLNDEHEDIRVESVNILRNINRRMSPKVENALIDKAGDESWKVREALVPAFSQMGNSKAVDLLIASLRDKDWRVRERAAEILGSNGVSKADDELIMALKDPNPNVREKAVIALKLRIRRAIHNREKSNLVDPLLEALKDDYPYVRKEAAMLFREVKDKRAIEPLIDMLGDDSPFNREAARSALKNITGNNFDSNKEIWKEWWGENKNAFLQSDKN